MQRSLGPRPATNGTTNGVNDHANGTSKTYELDACIVGAGFSGVYLLHRLRQEGFNVKIVEAGTALGGVWYWNSYPGARVDSQFPVYAYSIPELYNTWTWSERYPGEKELKRYFQHVDDILDISKDTLFGHKVVRAEFDASADKWRITCENGVCIIARYFLCCLGFAAKRHFPDWPGLDDYRGYICHSSFWPAGGVDMKGKRVAVVGTGATGIQIAQETAREAAHLTCFVRTPNFCVPMQQKSIDSDEHQHSLLDLPEQLQTLRYENIGGMLYPKASKSVLDFTPQERERVMDAAWQQGGFALAFAFTDTLTNQEANDVVYDFWARKRRGSLTDPKKRDLLVPLVPPHPFGGKRLSLEQDYYEQMDKPHVDLIDVRENPISHVVENGIVTQDGKLHELDVIAIATGFDSITGGYKDIEITGLNEEKLEEKWKMGTYTYLGMSVSNFPNFFYTYGPQAPTAYANGPTIIELQAKWIIGVLEKMRDQGKTRINADAHAEQEWKETIRYLHSLSLRDKTEGWYMGTNVPGKPREALNYAGGVPLYWKTISESLDQDFKGFTVT